MNPFKNDIMIQSEDHDDDDETLWMAIADQFSCVTDEMREQLEKCWK